MQRIEQSTLGTVYVCSYGGAKHGGGGCRRTYLSQRDLQAHVNHRHLKEASSDNTKSKESTKSSGKGSGSLDLYSSRPEGDSTNRPPPQGEVYPQRSEGVRISQSQPLVPTHLPPPSLALGGMHQPPPISQPLQQPPGQAGIDAYGANVAMMQGRSNLISIPIHEDTDYRRQNFMAPPLGMPPAVSFSTSVPPPGFPPPRFSQPSTITPPIHQGPPPVSYSTPQMNLGPMARFSSPPPISTSSGMNQPPPIMRPGGPPPPHLVGSGAPPQRFPNPPRGHFDDSSPKPPFGQQAGQGARGPWPGPPPQSQGGGPLGPSQQRPQSEYNRYY